MDNEGSSMDNHTKQTAHVDAAKQKTHKCFRCHQKFMTSGLLVIHMKEHHSAFVETAKEKIDRSKESSVNNKPFLNSAASCPHCKQNLQTRKKLMRHIEQEHKDEEQDEPEELKVIRLLGERKRKFLSDLKTVQDESGPEPNAPAIENLVRDIETESKKAKPPDIKVSTSKLSEKRYKCFWCDTSFRKRGKLMDHIDMFHKANKQQNEAEAELLLSLMISEEKVSAASTSVSETPTDSSPAMSSPTTSSSSAKVSQTSISTVLPPERPIESQTAYSMPEMSICPFKVLGSLTGERKRRISQEKPEENLCKFYNGKQQNPVLFLRKKCLTEQISVQPPAPTLPSSSSSIFMNNNYNKNYGLKSSNPPMTSPLSTRDICPTMHPFLFDRQPLYQNMSYVMPSQDYLMSQRAMLVADHQRSLAAQQYLANLASMRYSHPNSFNPERPLDLTKSKYFPC